MASKIICKSFCLISAGKNYCCFSWEIIFYSEVWTRHDTDSSTGLNIMNFCSRVSSPQLISDSYFHWSWCSYKEKIYLLSCWFQRTPGKAEQGVLELSFSSSVWRLAGEGQGCNLSGRWNQSQGIPRLEYPREWPCRASCGWKTAATCVLLLPSMQVQWLSVSVGHWFRALLITTASTGVTAVYLFLKHLLISIILRPSVKIVEYQWPIHANIFLQNTD